MDDLSPARTSLGDRIRLTWRFASLWLIFAGAVAGTIAAVSLPLVQAQSGVILKAGEVAPQDILAPYALRYTSAVLTAGARQEASEAVPDVYDPPDSRIARAQLEQLRDVLRFIDAVRADIHSTPEQRLSDLAAISNVRLAHDNARAILELPDDRWQVVKLEAETVLEQVMRNAIRDDGLEEARLMIPALVSVAIPENQAALVVHLVTALVSPNSRFNAEETTAAREQARQSVQPVAKSYAEGQTLVGRGQVVSPMQVEALQAFGLLRTPDLWRDIALRSLLVVLVASAFAIYGYQVHPKEIKNPRLAGAIAILFLVNVLATQLTVPGRAVLPYIMPAATMPILLAILMGPGMGVLSALISGALTGFLATRGLELALYVMLSGAMGALLIGKAERLSSFVWAGLAAALAAVSVVIVFRFVDPATDIVGKTSLVAAALFNGFLSFVLAFGLLLLIGNLLGVTTSLQLIELSRPDHPLLQFVLRNAPGTYQHSLQVANLAEQAARAIGANALLTRVAALYHDAGKALRPQFFIENQAAGQNIHEQMDPATSASVILSHVADGLELARKYRLPAWLQAFIPEHHGTLETSFQYHLALEAAGGDESRVDRRDFRYPGPRPRSREAAILMLADGVEAKARAESPETPEEIERLVRWVLDARLGSRQLDTTDLTLRDLESIRRSFINTLKGIYHPRIAYPSQPARGEIPAAVLALHERDRS